MKLAICIPLRGHVHNRAFAALTSAISYATLYWKRENGDDAGVYVISDSDNSSVAEARDKLARKAMELEVDWVLWFDGDAVPPHDILEKLMAHGKDLIVPVFCRREPPFGHTILNKCGGIGGGFEPAEIIPERLFEVDAAGFHTMLMKTQVLRDVDGKIKEPMFLKRPGMGEDVYFCQLAQKVGHQLWCDSSIKVGHVGSVVAYPVTEKQVEHATS